MPRPGLTFEGLKALAGQELGVSGWITVDQETINRFAECTGDRQWIYVDVERTRKESPFRKPIAHGYLTLSLVTAMAMDIDADTGEHSGGLHPWIGLRALHRAGEGRRARVHALDAGFDGGQGAGPISDQDRDHGRDRRRSAPSAHGGRTRHALRARGTSGLPERGQNLVTTPIPMPSKPPIAISACGASSRPMRLPTSSSGFSLPVRIISIIA